jgi:hypothetical protein
MLNAALKQSLCILVLPQNGHGLSFTSLISQFNARAAKPKTVHCTVPAATSFQGLADRIPTAVTAGPEEMCGIKLVNQPVTADSYCTL